MAPDQCAWPRARCDALAPPKCRKRRTPRRRPQTEPPWVWWRLVLLVSNPGGVGLWGSVERCFELGRRDIAAVAVKAVLVEPVDPREGPELELVDVVPDRRGVGSADALGLVEAVRRLGQRVV